MTSVSDRELKLIASVLTNIEGGTAALMGLIDWENVQVETEYNTVLTTKAMFRRLLVKMNGATAASTTNASSKAPKATTTASKPKGVVKTKASASKASASKASASKVSASKAGRGPKKETGSDEEGEDVDIGVKVEISDD